MELVKGEMFLAGVFPSPMNAKLEPMTDQHQIKDINHFVSIDIGKYSGTLVTEKTTCDYHIFHVDEPVIVDVFASRDNPCKTPK